MFEVVRSELALIQRQCERAHIEHPTAAMSLAMWNTRLPDFELPDTSPFNRTDGYIVTEYDHSLGYVRIYFYGSDESLALYKQIATAACIAMPAKTNADNWQEYLYEQRQSYGKALRVQTNRSKFVPLKENPFLASAIALDRLLTLPQIDSEALRRRSLESLREKFERAAERSPTARHCAVICNEQPMERALDEYSFKMLNGGWWRCRAEGVNMSEFGALCREGAHVCRDDPRCSLMPKPGGILAHDDAWMVFVHRLAWGEHAGTALLAFTEIEGAQRMSSAQVREEPIGLLSELRPNLYQACGMAIDLILAMPTAITAEPVGHVLSTTDGASVPPDQISAVEVWPGGEWRTAAWFRSATSDLLLPDAMRKAGARGLIRRHRLHDGDDWRYEVNSVVNVWPEHRVLIVTRIATDTNGLQRTPAYK